MNALSPAQRRALAAVARITFVAAPLSQAGCGSSAPSVGSDPISDAVSESSDATLVDADFVEVTDDGSVPDSTFGEADTAVPNDGALADGADLEATVETGLDYEPDGATVSGACGTFDPTNPTPDAVSCCANLAEAKVAGDAASWIRVDPSDPTQVACCYVVTLGVRDHAISLALSDSGPSVQYAALSNCCAIFDPPPSAGACLSWGPPMPTALRPDAELWSVA